MLPVQWTAPELTGVLRYGPASALFREPPRDTPQQGKLYDSVPLDPPVRPLPKLLLKLREPLICRQVSLYGFFPSFAMIEELSVHVVCCYVGYLY